MMAIQEWAERARQRVHEMNANGAQATLTFTDASKVSDNPAFFVDLDTPARIGRIVIWSDGTYDVHAAEVGSGNTINIVGWPSPITDENFEETLNRFVELVNEES